MQSIVKLKAKKANSIIQSLEIYSDLNTDTHRLEIKYWAKNEIEEGESECQMHSNSFCLIKSLFDILEDFVDLLEAHMLADLLKVLMEIGDPLFGTLYKISPQASAYLLCLVRHERSNLFIVDKDFENKSNPLKIIEGWNVRSWVEEQEIKNFKETYDFIKKLFPAAMMGPKREPEHLALSTLYFQLHEMIAMELIKAKQAEKKPLILLGERHKSPKAQFLLIVLLEMAAKFGFNHFTIEFDNLNRSSGVTGNSTWGRTLAKILGMQLHAIDKEHNNTEPDEEKWMKIRDEAMVNCLIQINDFIISLVGSAHLKGILNHPKIKAIFHVIAFNISPEESEFSVMLCKEAIEMQMHDGVMKLFFADGFCNMSPLRIFNKGRDVARQQHKIYNLLKGKEKMKYQQDIRYDEIDDVLQGLSFFCTSFKDEQLIQEIINDIADVLAEMSAITDLQGNEIFKVSTIKQFYADLSKLLIQGIKNYHKEYENKQKGHTLLTFSARSALLPAYFSLSSPTNTDQTPGTIRNEVCNLD